MKQKGKVILIGAGPGDPGLLTIKAQQYLLCAQTVVYDRLVGKDILQLLPSSAEKINVGKHMGNHPVPQEEINEILVREAEKGKTVIRLKGGDSFVFGRGGEELEALSAHGIEFEVVPGITSAISVPAYAGIPLTHRDYCSSFHVITGHQKKDGELHIDYEALVRLNGTLVFLMSVATIAEISKGLIDHGMSPKTECAIIQNGTRPNQKKYLATLQTISGIVRENRVTSPAIFVVGKVCQLSESFDWFDRLPLKGKKILVTSPSENSSRLAEKLKAYGAETRCLPAIKTSAIEFSIPDLLPYTMLTFTSAKGVHSFFEEVWKQGMDARDFYGKKFAVIGKQTGKALLSYGIQADFIPSVSYGKALAEELIQKQYISSKDRLLLIEPIKASPDLSNVLLKHGIPFDKLSVYETSFLDVFSIDLHTFDYITLTSASCVDSLVHQVDLSSFHGTAICIGEKTAEEAKKYNIKYETAKKPALDSMVDFIIGDDK